MEIINKKHISVSVIIDTYNYGMFIDDAIQSVLNQTFSKRDMEIIVIDDGSIDDTFEKVKKYRERIKYIYKKNGGQASAFNIGFENTKGKYIFLLDSDDYFLPTKVAKVVEEFERNKEVFLIYHPFIIKDELRGITYNQKLHLINGEIFKDIKKALLYPWQGTSGIIIKRETLKHIYPIPNKIKLIADAYLTGVIPFHYSIHAIPQYLSVYRIHKNNLYSFKQLQYNKIQNKRQCWYYLYFYIKKHLNKLTIINTKIKKLYILRYYSNFLKEDLNLKTLSRKFTLNHIRIEFIDYKLYSRFWNNKHKILKLIKIFIICFMPLSIYLFIKRIIKKHMKKLDQQT